MASVGPLDPYFTNLITELMALERQPVQRLTTEKDKLNIQKAVFSDLKTRLDNLHNSVRALRSSEATYALITGRKVTVAGADGASVATASVSTGALEGIYNLDVTQLARAHTVRSDQKAYSDQHLDLAGEFVIGGAGARNAVLNDPISDIVSAINEKEVSSGQLELGTGKYYIETRYDQATTKWQFRLVNEEGTAASIRQADGLYSNNWQAIPTDGNPFDTGRGLEITFQTATGNFDTHDRLSGAAEIDYTAKGATIQVEDTDSLSDIAAAINTATYAESNGVRASVIDRRLVFQSALTGEAHTITAADLSGDTVLQTLGVLNADNATFKNYDPLKDSAQDAIFKINDIAIRRSRNTAINDAMSGMTLNLAADAPGKSATLTVISDTAAARSAVNTFVARFNELQSYLKGKLSNTKNADGNYTRGSLAGETMLRSLNMDLFSSFTARLANNGIYSRLSEIGLTLNDSMEATVSDASKLDKALQSNFSDVQKLMDVFMQSLDGRLSKFSGDNGYASQSGKTTASMIENLETRITEYNRRLTVREEQLREQYAGIQTQLMQLSYMQQQWSSIYNSFSSMSVSS
jgi:flagellar hook-associated protein 2